MVGAPAGSSYEMVNLSHGKREQGGRLMVSHDNDFLPTVLISSPSVGLQIDRRLVSIKLFKSTLANKRNVAMLQCASVCHRSDL